MKLYLLLIVFVAAGCASQVTQPSVSPEGVFRNTTVAKVQTLIADKCLSKPGRTVEDVNPMQITCTGSVDYGMGNVSALLYVGGSTDEQVQVKVKYTLMQRDADVRVVGNCWLQNRSVEGSDMKRALMDANSRNTIRVGLVNLGAE